MKVSIFSSRCLFIITFFLIIFLFGQSVFAEEPGIKIAEPQNGTTVVPGQQIKVTVEPLGGFVIKEGLVGIGSSNNERITILPATFYLTVPNEVLEKAVVSAFTFNATGKMAFSKVTLNVKQTSPLESIKVSPEDYIFVMDWDDSIDSNDLPITAIGVFGDGVERDIADVSTTYTSSDPSVASVSFMNNAHRVQAHKLGTAQIIVSNSGIQATIPVTVKRTTRMKPSEMIPPTSSIDIKPAPNAAGWCNKDITITLTGTDNAGGTGMQGINYWLKGITSEDYSKQEFVKGDTVTLTNFQEGETYLGYFSFDNEGNQDITHYLTLKLDKTPPVTKAAVTPAPDASGWIKELPVKVTFTATDNLSGVAFTTENKTITEGGIYNIEYFSRDTAGNSEQPKILNLKIGVPTSVEEDKTPPEITLNAILKFRFPILEKMRLVFVDFYQLSYSASDRDPGLKEVHAGLVTPDITGFKIITKKKSYPQITVNPQTKQVTIEAPNPQGILAQLQKMLLLVNNKQFLSIKPKPLQNIWKISKIGNTFTIEAPAITLKAEATDYYGNTGTKELRLR